MLNFKSKIYTFYRRDDAMESDECLDGTIGWSIIIVIRIVQSDTTRVARVVEVIQCVVRVLERFE